MTLVQLEYIVAVDTYRSFVTAAEKCFVTQPTLSMQIQKLEDNLGVKLFDRSKQPVIPTEIGLPVIEQARMVLAESTKLQEIIAVHKNELAGELKIGVIPTIAPYLLPKVIMSFTAKYPKVQLSIWEYTTEQIILNLKNGLLDCGILSTPLEDKSLQEIPLFYENFVIYASESSTIGKKKNISSEEINIDETTFRAQGELPRCPHCGGLARPNVLMFGDGQWCLERSIKQESKLFSWLSRATRTRLVVVEMGAGTAIPTVRRLGEKLSYEGATLIRINPRESNGPTGTFSLPMGAKEGLQAIDEALQENAVG
ncbi:MAG: LysR family transcriptional regulator [Chitinophagaceae bacterium]|nr:MAG: LysR family transcriptional regulator [Chitinophagaceae bacterium]